jgi:hypothetical protein
MGTVIDASTKNPVPFCNVYFPNSDVATTTDFDGKYSIETKFPKDTLYAQFIGYLKQKKTVVKNKFQMIDFELTPNTIELAAIEVRPGENPAEIILKKVIKNKDLNDLKNLDAYQYEVYSKIQVDANNYSSEITNNIFLRPFSFVMDYSDTSTINGKVYLPVYITENISDVYYRRQPKTEREIIKATRGSGMKSSTMSQLTGDSYQKINVYDNYNLLFEKNFVSPIANFGLAYYRYYLIDTVNINNLRCFHIKFKPRRPQELTYTGDFWVEDTTYGIVKADFRIAKDANINIINEIVVHKEFDLVGGKYWMPTVDNMIADLNVFENPNKVVGLFVHKSSSYNDFVINQLMSDKFYREPQNIVVIDSAIKRDNSYWEQNRHDSLSLQEQNIYKMVDTVQSLKTYKLYTNILFALSTDHIRMGYLEYGPISSTFSTNNIEGQRFKFGLRTANKFSKKIMISGYVAYGTRDDKFKYGGSVLWWWKKNPNSGIFVSYKKDLGQLGMSNSAMTSDFMLRGVLSRNSGQKLSWAEYFDFSLQHEWFVGLSNTLYFHHRQLYPLAGEASFFKINTTEGQVGKSSLTVSEIQLDTRLAFSEKFLSGEFERFSLGTKYPILGISYVYGAKNLFNGDYEYHKLTLDFSHWFNVGTIGWSKYQISAGKIWGTLPYPFLKIHEGNQTYIYDGQSFNTMNYYEFISDQYVSFFYTHHFDGLLFNKIPLFRRLHWREVVHYRYLNGSLSKANRNYSVFPENSYRLTGPYQEVGVGIENIFKVIRIDGVWRLNYRDHPNIRKFMLMISFSFYF